MLGLPLTEKIFRARDNTIYHLYQSRFGINVLRTDERLRAVLATREVAQHLRLPAGAPVLEIRRVALDYHLNIEGHYHSVPHRFLSERFAGIGFCGRDRLPTNHHDRRI